MTIHDLAAHSTIGDLYRGATWNDPWWGKFPSVLILLGAQRPQTSDKLPACAVGGGSGSW